MSELITKPPLTDRGFTVADTRAYITRIEAQLKSQGRSVHSLEFVLIRGLVDMLDESQKALQFYASTQNYIAHVDQSNGSRRPSRVIEDAGTRARAMMRRLTQGFVPHERKIGAEGPEDRGGQS